MRSDREAEDSVRSQRFEAGHRALTAQVVRPCFGALLVFYNVTVVSYSLPFVGRALFQSTDGVQVALNTLALVATGYLAKPVAQLLTGRYADAHGRRPVLAAASLVTASSTLLLALLPTERVIGIGAPIVFVLVIAIQAAAAGAEWPLLAAYIAESTSVNRRGFFTAYCSFNVCLGWLLAILVPLTLHGVLTDHQYAQWGWRVALAPAMALGVFAFFLRRRLPESARFTEIRESGQLSTSPVHELFQRQAKTWGIVMLHVGMVSAGFYLTVAFPVAFVILADKFGTVESLVISAAGLTALLLVILPAGMLADRFGPRRVSALGYLGAATLAVPSYRLMSEGDMGLALTAVIALGVALGLPAGVYEGWLVSSFPTRYTGAATTANGVGIALFGTPILWLATRLADERGYLAPGLLLVAVGLIGALTTRMLPATWAAAR